MSAQTDRQIRLRATERQALLIPRSRAGLADLAGCQTLAQFRQLRHASRARVWPGCAYLEVGVTEPEQLAATG